jgi:hypothetical protein
VKRSQKSVAKDSIRGILGIRGVERVRPGSSDFGIYTRHVFIGRDLDLIEALSSQLEPRAKSSKIENGTSFMR